MTAPSELVDVGLREANDPGLRYHRLVPQLGRASSKLDDGSSDNIAALERDAAALIELHHDELRSVCATLRERGGWHAPTSWTG